ncbi:insulinase family protein, partial [Pseudomonas sp. RA_35y_Pfl2_P32]
MIVYSRASRLALLAFLTIGAAPQHSVRAPESRAEAQQATPSSSADATDGRPGAAIASRAAWLYKGSDITPDPAWHFGVLKNGLRYAVRKNGVPPGQISVRVRIDAGSLYENEGERGFAHLIEHLSFRGSEYVPDGEAKR